MYTWNTKHTVYIHTYDTEMYVRMYVRMYVHHYTICSLPLSSQVLTREVLCVVIWQWAGCLGELLQTTHIPPLGSQVDACVTLAVGKVD